MWPDHCLYQQAGDEGQRGWDIAPFLKRKLEKWENKSGKRVTYIFKGKNNRVEMYSCLRAEIPDPYDSNTALNVELLLRLKGTQK